MRLLKTENMQNKYAKYLMEINQLTVPNEKVKLIEETAPGIISASRSTDIVAFYVQWMSMAFKCINR